MKNIRQVLKQLEKLYPGLLFNILLYGILSGLRPLLIIVLPKLIIDEITGLRRISHVIFYIGGLTVANFILNIITEQLYQKIEYQIYMAREQINYQLLSKANRLPLEFQESKTGQDMIEQAIYSTRYIDNLPWFFVKFLSDIVGIISVLIIILTVSRVIPVAIILSGLVVYPILDRLRKTREEYVKIKSGTGRVFRYFIRLSEDYKYTKDLKMFDGVDLMMGKSKTQMDQVVADNRVFHIEEGVLNGAVAAILQFQSIFVLVYLIRGLLRSTIAVGNFTMIFNASVQLQTHIKSALENLSEVLFMENIYKDMLNFMAIKEETEDLTLTSSMTEKLDSDDVTIEFEDVDFKYPGSENWVLKDLSFKIEPGETVALVGRNGSGKTTMINLICRFYQPDKGKIYFNGVDIQDIPLDTYYDLLAVTFQSFRLFPFRISENVTNKVYTDIRDKDQKTMTDTFKIIGIESWVNSQIDRENTFISTVFSEHGTMPSGGIGQKLALSRSMFHNGKFIIMDEPTAALDPRSEEEIFNHMIDITKNKTTLFISHRLSSTKDADRILVCSDKNIVEEGTHEELMENNGLYKEMFDAQATHYRN